jgi:alpha-galactosidase
MKSRILLCLCLAAVGLFGQKFEGLALTPPMGWNSWNHFACDVDEAIIREVAEAMVTSGMKDAGYRYINIDDCWHGERDSLGFIHPDPGRFPSGMKALGDYIHSLGLKFGIYSDAGWKTCGGRPGSRGHEFQDAMQYAAWGVDYLKYDWCYTEGLKAEGAYLTMRDALYAAGRPIVFSLCEWGNDEPWKWGAPIGHLWRTTGDIAPVFDGEINHGSWSSWGVLQIIDMRPNIRQYAGPDHWNDPDMMEVGNGMSRNEDRAHFSMWCMLAAPLIAGNDIRKMSPETLEILTNKEVIAVDQDSLGIQGFPFLMTDSVEVWAKPLMNDALAVCFLNRAKSARSIEFSWKDHSVRDELNQKEYLFDQNKYRIRDLWKRKDAGDTGTVFKRKIPSHDVIVLKLSK